MRTKKGLKWLALIILVVAFLVVATGCGGDDTANTGNNGNTGNTGDTGATDEGPSSITILIPEDPAGFNGLVTDTGYEQLLGELLMLSVTVCMRKKESGRGRKDNTRHFRFLTHSDFRRRLIDWR